MNWHDSVLTVSVSFDKKPERQTILDRWASYRTVAQQLALPSAPTPFVRYMEEQDRPQTKLDRDFENGMGTSAVKASEKSRKRHGDFNRPPQRRYSV